MKPWIVSFLFAHLLGSSLSFALEKPLGSAKAKPGGTFFYCLRKEPILLNYFSSNDLYSRIVQRYILESLLARDPDTHAWIPALAEKWEISKDGKQFTFVLRDGAKFHDGKPVTVEDVKFSFDAISNPAYDASTLRPYYEGLEKLEILDPKTVRLTAKEKYFGNFESAAGISVLPKHLYGDPEKAKKNMNTQLVGSGPYILETFDRGNRVVLKRNPEWWGFQTALYKQTNNFERVWFRYQSQDNLMVEMLKKGTIDFIDEDSVNPEMYMKNAQGPEWGKTVIKEKVENFSPRSYGYIGWNLRLPLFSDKKVRHAMTHLMNRQLMIEKFRYNLSVPATGPLSLFSDYASKKVKALAFDPKKAVQLLGEAGWKDTDKDGVLDKMIDGKKADFTFTLLYAGADREKYYTLYKEDLKKAGVRMDLKLVEFNTMIKLLKERKFDAIAMAWAGGGVDWDPKQIWHSESDNPNGSNYVGYKDPEVDKLIDEARAELNDKKRTKLLHVVYEKIADAQPYTFMFNDKFVLYMHTSRIGMEKPTYRYGLFTDSWWIN